MKNFTAAQGAARRASSLTHRLLAFSRRQALRPEALPEDLDRALARDAGRVGVLADQAVDAQPVGRLGEVGVVVQQLRGMLLAGAASEPAEPAAASYFEDLRRRVLYRQRESTAWTLR